MASTLSRRDLLTRSLPALALTLLFPACGQSNGAAPGPPERTSPRATAATIASGVAQRTNASVTLRNTPLAVPTATAMALLPDPCQGLTYTRASKPSDPYVWRVASDGPADSSVDKVQRYSDLIIVGTVLDILPALWTTPDSQRPDNPHESSSILIITPVRVSVEHVAKGTYDLPHVYFKLPGGRIGQDCASVTGSGPRPAFRTGERFLYFINPSPDTSLQPVSGDSRYHYYRAANSYTVTPNGMVTIGPEYDIMGGHVDDPPRTLTVNQVLDEIAALLAAPATPTK